MLGNWRMWRGRKSQKETNKINFEGFKRKVRNRTPVYVTELYLYKPWILQNPVSHPIYRENIHRGSRIVTQLRHYLSFQTQRNNINALISHGKSSQQRIKERDWTDTSPTTWEFWKEMFAWRKRHVSMTKQNLKIHLPNKNSLVPNPPTYLSKEQHGAPGEQIA